MSASESERNAFRFRRCEVCGGQDYDTTVPDHVFHHDAEPHEQLASVIKLTPDA